MTSRPEPIIELERVTYVRRPGEAPVLRELSLRVGAGEWVCIVGRNGSGKSTLLRLLNGLLPATSGRIRVDGLTLAPDTLWEVRERTGFLSSNPDHQLLGFTVADDIMFGLENRGLPRETIRERVRRYAERLGLEPLLNRHPDQLSGGQKQRAAIAAVLALEPRIVLLDEVTSYLDEASRREVLGILREMKDSGRYTIVSATHDEEEMRLADRLLVLDGGTVIADGAPRDILRRDDLLKAGGMRPTFALQVCRELRKRGVDIGDHPDEEGLVEALWRYKWSTSTSAILTGSRANPAD
ncbi:MAG: energy-coupling factor ABC transporter ATP-binding protein [Thermobacillus sp. ZCTH02-B1]|uniref:ATP-binding cassette domain-containing protein n=1 Tax=Thermobacillus sp. ZCTH02-B1 TaxID=1858795 RepID=UPI000B571A74|nr:ATP-binding cassette domain-containing protein [Thermobacillus sp. ZCTH02-B1]OUM94585.1 MAG: energy-coupling factor ABC transporter ATP-binding protein [Thermobacillus sp. ZCTH02-B1]